MILHEIHSEYFFSLVKKLQQKFLTEKFGNNIHNFKFHPSLTLKSEYFNEKYYHKIINENFDCIAHSEEHLSLLRSLVCKIPENGIISHFPLENTKVIMIPNDADCLRKFYNQTNDALTFIKENAPGYFKRFSSIIKEIIPQVPCRPTMNTLSGSGLSTSYYWGGIFLEPPMLTDPNENFIEYLLDIAHEVGHQVLFVLQSADHLVKNANDLTYSPIRKINRPILRSIHAVAAISEMMLLCGELLQNQNWNSPLKNILHRRYNELRYDLVVGLSSLKNSSLTDIGHATCCYWYSMIEKAA